MPYHRSAAFDRPEKEKHGVFPVLKLVIFSLKVTCFGAETTRGQGNEWPLYQEIVLCKFAFKMDCATGLWVLGKSSSFAHAQQRLARV